MKRFFKIIIFLFVFLILLDIAGRVLMPDWETNTNIKGLYYEKPNSIDVVFLGDSDIFSSVSPMEIYNKYGITSYDYAAPAISNMVMYYMLEEVLHYQTPMIIVMDATSIFNGKDQEVSTRKPIDAMKWGDAKVNFLNDPVYNFSFYDKFTFVSPFFRYHARWNELTISDFTKLFKHYFSPSKGYLIDYKTVPSNNEDDYMKKTKDTIDFSNSYMTDYVLKAKALCESKGITFILTSMPDTKEWNYAKYKRLSSWAKDNEVTYIDYNTLIDDIGIDFDTDSRDGGIHLNTKGAIKISNYIADYLHDNYELSDHRNDSYYSNWNDDLVKYNIQKEEKVK